MKTSPNNHTILKVFWLILAILTAVWGVYALIQKGIQDAWPIFLMTLFSVMFFYVRRNQARRDT
ncbi:MAG: hypothetical protein JW801_18765 [Bacteroidales bacterium]|nr:hypothetical protein [Bacteroidales bacterium]